MGLQSVSCGALQWLSQSALLQCQRGAQCQLTEAGTQKGLVRGHTAVEGHDGSRLPQNMGKILCRNKLQPRVDGSLGSHNEPSKWLHCPSGAIAQHVNECHNNETGTCALSAQLFLAVRASDPGHQLL